MILVAILMTGRFERYRHSRLEKWAGIVPGLKFLKKSIQLTGARHVAANLKKGG